MPELPEVETITRSVTPHLIGRRILNAEFRCARVLLGESEQVSSALAGQTITGVERRGKFIVVLLESGGVFAIHLGMTGKLLLGGLPGRHTHAILTLDRGVLLYDDPRQFGRLEFSAALPERIARLGPEPLEVDFERFFVLLRRRKTRIKALLLNQSFLRGLGNIYADEALFRARIHPLAMASRLRRDRAQRLFDAIVEVLTEAVEKGGSSISDYVDAEGRKGLFQLSHRVYQRTGEPCMTCGAPIRRTLVAQRSTHFCSRCQKH